MFLVAERNIFKKLIHREWTKIKNSPFKVGWGAVEPSTSTTIGLTNLLSPGDILLVSWFKFTIDGKNDFYRRELSFSFLWASTIPIQQCLFLFCSFFFSGVLYVISGRFEFLCQQQGLSFIIEYGNRILCLYVSKRTINIVDRRWINLLVVYKIFLQIVHIDWLVYHLFTGICKLFIVKPAHLSMDRRKS